MCPPPPPPAVFDGIFKRSEKALMAKQVQVRGASEAAFAAATARDSVRANIDALKRKADAERAEFEAKWRAISQV